MARMEFRSTSLAERLGVAGKTFPVALQPSIGALARAEAYFETTTLGPAARVVAAVWESLSRGGAKPSFHDVARMRDGSGLSDDMVALIDPDFVMYLEPGDPGYNPPSEPDEDESGEDVAPSPTGAAEPAGAAAMDDAQPPTR